MSEPSCSRVVLVGFMGAGKSTVGRRLAARLGWGFVDVDAEVERRAGQTIAEIFEEHGEPAFRAMEDEATTAALDADATVVAVGGGWAAGVGRLRAVPEGTVSVWLDVSLDEALRRIADGSGRRPLLEVDDPVETARLLLDSRRGSYADADVGVDTNGLSVDDVTARILEILAKLGIESSPE